MSIYICMHIHVCVASGSLKASQALHNDLSLTGVQHYTGSGGGRLRNGLVRSLSTGGLPDGGYRK